MKSVLYHKNIEPLERKNDADTSHADGSDCRIFVTTLRAIIEGKQE